MSKNTNIGIKIKELRNEKNLTLKQLSEKTGLSVGFLSQLERGLSNIAIDSLQNLADALNVSMNEILDTQDSFHKESPLLRSYEKSITIISPSVHSYILTHSIKSLPVLPREYHLMPNINDETELQIYSHEGFEWIYIIEGILSVRLENQTFDLYPGDTITIDSTKPHNWYNRSNKITKFIAINTPNPFLEK